MLPIQNGNKAVIGSFQLEKFKKEKSFSVLLSYNVDEKWNHELITLEVMT
jgi:hypothetical protein